MNPYYFTFGCSSENGRKYVKILAESWDAARDIMFNHYGKQWGFQYDEAGFAGQIEEYGLTELLTIKEDV